MSSGTNGYYISGFYSTVIGDFSTKILSTLLRCSVMNDFIGKKPLFVRSDSEIREEDIGLGKPKKA